MSLDLYGLLGLMESDLQMTDNLRAVTSGPRYLHEIEQTCRWMEKARSRFSFRIHGRREKTTLIVRNRRKFWLHFVLAISDVYAQSDA
jgi:hypothetical protein